MSHNANFFGNNINTDTYVQKMLFKMAKTRVVLVPHLQGGKQELRLQAHGHGDPISFFFC